jgi:hypothetical protein
MEITTMRPWTPDDIHAALDQLSQPFPLEVISLKVGATAEQDGRTNGLALPYASWWTGYLPILNRVIGLGSWSITLTPWGEHKVIATLRAFGGAITHQSSGEREDNDPNAGTSAEAQAKKRVCAEGLGLGLYLYRAPKLWGTVERKGKGATFSRQEEQRLKLELSRTMGLLTDQSATSSTPTPTPLRAPAPPAEPSHIAPDPDRLARARAALAQGEERSAKHAPRTPAPAPRTPAPTHERPASDKQRGAIAAILYRCKGVIDYDAINAIGSQVGIARLSQYTHAERIPELSGHQASQLISLLDAAAPAQRRAS